MWSGNDQDDGGKNDGGSKDGAQRDRLVGNQPAEEERHHGIHEGIGRHSGRGAFLEDVNVRAEPDARAKHDQVGERYPRTRGDGGEMEPMKLSRDQASDEQGCPTREALHGHPQKRGAGHAAMFGIYGTAGPGKRSDYQDSDAAHVDARRASEMRGTDQERDSRKAQDDPEEDFGDRPSAARAKPVHNDQPQRNHGHQQRGNARGHNLLGPTDSTVSGEQQETARHGGGAPMTAGWLNASLPAKEGIKEQSYGEMTKASQH